MTADNCEFIKEVVDDRYVKNTPHVSKDDVKTIEWTPGMQRTGVIARKIGIYPLWLKNGKKISTTLLQVMYVMINRF